MKTKERMRAECRDSTSPHKHNSSTCWPRQMDTIDMTNSEPLRNEFVLVGRRSAKQKQTNSEHAPHKNQRIFIHLKATKFPLKSDSFQMI